MADQPEVVIVDPSGTEHHFPAGFDPQRAAGIVRASFQAPTPPTPTGHYGLLDAARDAFKTERDQGVIKGASDLASAAGTYAKENPAATGALVAGTIASGGLAGAPALTAIPAVGLAGAAGAGTGLVAKHLASGESQHMDVGDTLGQMAQQGALQAAGEGVGRGAAALANKGATFLMNRAVNASDRLAREFPNLSQTLIDNAIAVSQGGYGKARLLLANAKGDANAALMLAEKAGKTVPIQLTPEIADSLKTAATEAAMKGGKASSQAPGSPLTVATERLAPQVQVFLNTIDAALKNGTPITLTPTEADMLKTQLQRESKSLYLAMRGPNGTPAIGQSAAVKAEFASRLNDAIDGIAGGYKAANAKAQEMLGASRAVQQAVRPGKNLYMAMVRPTTGAVMGGLAGEAEGHPGAGAALGAAATTPTGMSYEALTLANPVVQTLLKQLPRGLATVISAYLQPRPTVASPAQ